MQRLMVRTRHKQAATVLRYHSDFSPHDERTERWVILQDTILPFELITPTESVLLDVTTLYEQFARVPATRQSQGKRYRLLMLLQPTLRQDLETLVDPGLVDFAGGPEALDFRTAQTVEKGHGRLEERPMTVSCSPTLPIGRIWHRSST